MPQELHLQLSISGRKIAIGLFITCIVMLCLNLIGVYFKLYLGENWFWSNAIYFFFDASREGSFQTIFSTLLLITAAVIVGLIGLMLDRKHPTRKYWFVLGILFSFLALDESLTIHEQFNKLRPVVNDESGFFYYSWIIPYLGLVILAGLFFFRFLLLLPPDIRNLFIISGVVYVGGAIGFEALEGYVVSHGGPESLNDKLLCAVEEFLEMSGVTLFIYATLKHIKSLQKEIEVSFG